jgi:2-dehydro-3-deoxyphosphogluconate aldolase/(4S)-4-hydroxy-2-oxoglutarate aldolase
MAEEFDSVKELGLCVLHVGINANGEEDAKKIAEDFQTLMGFVPKFGNSSIFASPLIEIMKNGGPGEKGHIAIGAHDVDKAAAYFESTGMGINKDKAKYNEDGTMQFVYLSKEIGGFAIHLKQY